MRIHTDVLTRDDVRKAATGLDGVHVDVTEHGSRSRSRAFDLHVTADKRPGRRWRNTGNHGAASDEAAATWDEWGQVLSYLFTVDPDAVVPGVYHDAEHFHWSTGSRFVIGGDRRPSQWHDDHRWTRRGTAATGAYDVLECRADDCDAITRRVAYGHTWDEIAGMGS